MSELRHILDTHDPELAWLIDQCRERFGTQLKRDQIHVIAPGIEVGDPTLTETLNQSSGPLAFPERRQK